MASENSIASITSRIALNIGRLTGSFWAEDSTAHADARFIAESCLKALETSGCAVVASEYVEVAEKRLDGAVAFSDNIQRWAKECVRDTRAFIFAAETARR